MIENRIDIYGDNRFPEHSKVREACRGIVIRDGLILLTYEVNTDQWFTLFQRTRIFTAKEYGVLLGTYSDHIAIDEVIRKEFFSKIEDAINDHGGTITIYDTIDLQLARKP